jgi:3',5'-cyclic AMP phosphodiesterase CpdA
MSGVQQPGLPGTQFPPAEQLIVHLSDTHLTTLAEPLHGNVDADANLAEALAGLVPLRPTALVITGDLADTGASDAYERLKAAVEPAAAQMGAEVIWVMGNHDAREPFREVLLGEIGTDAAALAAPVDRVHDVDGLRIVVLDSTVPGHHHGEIAPEQLEWLRGVLAEPAPRGTLLALHHPPVPTPLGLMALVELRDQAALAEVLAGSDVRGILAGHLHYSTWSTFAGIPVSVASATCYTMDLRQPGPGVRGQAGGQSVNLVHVYGDRVVHSIVPLGEWPTAYEVTAEQLQYYMSLPPEEQLALANGATLPE